MTVLARHGFKGLAFDARVKQIADLQAMHDAISGAQTKLPQEFVLATPDRNRRRSRSPQSMTDSPVADKRSAMKAGRSISPTMTFAPVAIKSGGSARASPYDGPAGVPKPVAVLVPALPLCGGLDVASTPFRDGVASERQ